MNTRDHGTVIVSQNPDKRGPDRYWHCVAEEPPPFCLFCDQAWGGDRRQKWAAQRAKWVMPPTYKLSYLKKMLHGKKTRITRDQVEGDTDYAHDAQTSDPFGVQD